MTLSFLAVAGDPVLGAALRSMSAADLLAATTGAGSDGRAVLSGVPEGPALARAMTPLARPAGPVPSEAMLAAWQQAGLRLVLPGDPEWPTQLDDLGDARPLVLWVRGSADLRYACLRSVSMVGARAATAYGNHVALELAAAVAEHGPGSRLRRSLRDRRQRAPGRAGRRRAHRGGARRRPELRLPARAC